MNIRDTARKLRNEYLIRVRHEPRDSRRVGGSCTYVKAPKEVKA